MSYGWVEECGIRCNYHGWKFDHTGACIDQPFEEIAHPDARFKDRITIKAYPVEERAGLLWAYMGPLPAPEVPVWEPFTWGNGFVQIVHERDPVQLVPVPGELDRPGPLRVAARQLGPAPARPDQRQEAADPPADRASTSSSTASPTTAFARASPNRTSCGPSAASCLWPNCLFTGNHFEWRVPIDDEQHAQRGLVLRSRARGDGAVPPGAHPVLVRADQRRADRPLARLARHEPGLRRLGRPGRRRRSDPGAPGRERPRHHPDAQAHARGGREGPRRAKSPRRSFATRRRRASSSCRSSAATSSWPAIRCATWPTATRGIPLSEEFVFQAGQPEEITQAYRDAMGMNPDGTPRLSEAGVSV